MSAQQLSGYEVGLNAGGFIYQGDLSPSLLGSYKTMRLGVGISVSRRISKAVSVRANVVHSQLKGDDTKYNSPVWRPYRNFKFSSPITEISALIVYDIVQNRGNDRRFTPYVFAGGGLSSVRTRRDYSQFDEPYFSTQAYVIEGLDADIAQILPTIIAVLPVGIGLRYPLAPRLSLNTETTFRVTPTDYLDGFSKAANPKRKDRYQSHTIGVVYSFKRNHNKCPAVF